MYLKITHKKLTNFLYLHDVNFQRLKTKKINLGIHYLFCGKSFHHTLDYRKKIFFYYLNVKNANPVLKY